MSDAEEITPDDYRLDASPVDWLATVGLADGTAHDITRELRVLYDLVVTSMDFGSGFLDAEDMDTIRRIAELCDFDLPEQEIDYAYQLTDGTPVSLTGVPLSGIPNQNDKVAELRAKYEGREGYEIRERVVKTDSRYPAVEGDQICVTVVLTGRKRGDS